MGLPGYELHKVEDSDGLLYVFKSTGAKEIVKVIEYALLSEVRHDIIKTERIFNLGFADMDIETGYLPDNVTSDNGDVFRVFNTVLNTIPMFFERYYNETIVVTGSDSTEKFATMCFETCGKRCKAADDCKNKHRRINVYLTYVNKNYDTLKNSIIFMVV